MTKVLRLHILIVLCFLGTNRLSAQVQVYEDSLMIPTYALDQLDAYPEFAALGGKLVYPYPMQDQLTRTPLEKMHRTLVLENQYVRVTVLPDLGGRLYSFFDKTFDREILYRNNVIKPGLIGLRGAWMSGGIEWNFPNAHSVTTHSPVFRAIRQNRDGSATILIGNVEKVSRMYWTVSLTLELDATALRSDILLYNRTDLPHRYYFWANAAFPARERTRFLSPARYQTNHAGDYIYKWPEHDGVDLSWNRDHQRAGSFFGLDVPADYFGVYDYDADAGIVHVADHLKVAGKKFWTWGNSEDGNSWVDILSDNDGQYVEFQSGRFANQSTWRPLQPQQVVQWTEWWYPVRQIQGFRYANENAAIQLEAAEDTLVVGINATGRWPNAVLQVESEGSVQATATLNLNPALPLRERIVVANAERCAVRLLVDDTELLYFDPLNRVESSEYNVGAREPEITVALEDMESDALLRKSTELWLAGDWQSAEAVLLEGLEKNPKHVGLLTRQAFQLMEAGKFDEAEAAAEVALEQSPWDSDANYTKGLAALQQEKYSEARRAFGRLLDDPAYGNSMLLLIGRTHMLVGEYRQAAQLFEDAARRMQVVARPRIHQAIAMRAQGLMENALTITENAWREDPLSPLAQAEMWTCLEALGRKSDAQRWSMALRRAMRTDPDIVLEAATEYMALGDDRAAFELLRNAAGIEGAIPKDTHPIVLFYLADAASRLDMPASVERFLRAASRQSPRGVLPYRTETLTVLNSVLRAHPQNAVARYYAGNILAGKYCLDEARTMWRESIALDARNPLAQRNFGLMQSKILKDGPAATAAYQQAIAAAPDDIRLYAELDAVYRQFSIAGLTQRENIIMGLEKGADNALITSAAEVFNRQMMYELTLELLEQHSVDVWENGYYIHDLFSDAHIGNGLVDYDKRRYKESLEHFQAAMTYPENLGVGKPQKEQMANAKYYAARALRALRKRDEAQTWYESAVAEELDVLSPLKYYQGLAHRAMGHNGLAETRFREMIEAAKSEAAEQSGLAPLLEGLGYNGLGASKQSQEALSKFLQSTRPGHTSAQLRRLRYRFLPLAERLQDK